MAELVAGRWPRSVRVVERLLITLVLLPGRLVLRHIRDLDHPDDGSPRKERTATLVELGILDLAAVLLEQRHAATTVTMHLKPDLIDEDHPPLNRIGMAVLTSYLLIVANKRKRPLRHDHVDDISPRQKLGYAHFIP